MSILTWENLLRVIKWIPTWQGLDVFQKYLHSCALNKSSLTIGRVKGFAPMDWDVLPVDIVNISSSHIPAVDNRKSDKTAKCMLQVKNCCWCYYFLDAGHIILFPFIDTCRWLITFRMMKMINIFTCPPPASERDKIRLSRHCIWHLILKCFYSKELTLAETT